MEREGSGIENVDIVLNKISMFNYSNTTAVIILTGTESLPVATLLIRAD